MEIRPIHTEADYKAALHEVSAFFDSEPEPGTPDGDRFEVLLVLVESYEAKHYPMDPPDPIEAILFRMEQQGLSRKDLEPMIGARNRLAGTAGRTAADRFQQAHGRRACGRARARERQRDRALPERRREPLGARQRRQGA